jgi:type I restriction enzyme S subunit
MIESWNYVRFGDLFDYENKSKIKAGDGISSGSFPFFTSSVEQTKFIDQFQFNRTSLIFGTGGNASIHFCDSPFSVSTDCLVAFTKDETQVYPKFVYFYLSGNMNLLEDGFKGAGLKHISKGYINEIKIPLPPLETQKRIAEILDAADALRQKDHELLKKYDELAQAIFIDVFGDPMKNKKGWKVKSLNAVTNKITDGEHGTVERINSGYPYLMARNIRDGYIDLNEIDFISKNDHKRIFKRCNPEMGDLLLVCVGATIGRVCLMSTNEEYSLARSVALIKPNKLYINSKFLYFLFKTEYIQRQIKASKNIAAQAGLYTGKIKELEIILPPIDIQEKFEIKVNSLLKQKLLIKPNNPEMLFKTLIQKAFKGELVL